ncbi:erv26 superfamily protein [Umbelopsis sp. WA50703]
MTFLHLVAYGATILAFCFVVLSLACGLYYLAELVEEYTVFTKKIIKYATMVVVFIHICLWIFDRKPFFQIVFSLICHGVYSMNLQTFPFISLTSPAFLASCVLVLVDHFVWFQYFTRHYTPFMDIAAFFGICVWLIPFTYFISLSANDNALPLSDPNAADAIPSQRKQGLFKTILGYVTRRKDDALPSSHINVQEYNITPNVGLSSGLSSSMRIPYASTSLDNRKMM